MERGGRSAGRIRIRIRIKIKIRIKIRIKSVIKRERGGTGDPEREDGAGAVGLGFEGVGVEGRGVVRGIQIMQPVEIAEHEAGAEADGAPLAQVVIDECGVTNEILSAAV